MKSLQRKAKKKAGRARRLGYSETRQEFLDHPRYDEWSNVEIGGDGSGEERDTPITWKDDDVIT